jgi:hypothetical protein
MAVSLEQLIIDLARQQVDRANIIQSLVSRGYTIDTIERVLNELYYAGKLSFDMSASLEQVGVQTIDNAVTKRVPFLGLSFLARMRVWIHIHTKATLAISSLVVSILAAIVGGVWGYQTSPTVIMNRALARIAVAPSLAYRIATTTIALNESDSITFFSQGVMTITPSPRATADISFQKNNETPWKFTLIHTDNDTLYININQGPALNPFLYNKWIQFSTAQKDTQLLTDFGLGDVVSHIGFFRSFAQSNPVRVVSAFMSVPGSYTALFPQENSIPCAHLYTTSFNTERIRAGASFFINPDIKIISSLLQAPWSVCINANNSISQITVPISTYKGLKNMTIDIFVPQSLPSFNIDVPAISLDTVASWKDSK